MSRIRAILAVALAISLAPLPAARADEDVPSFASDCGTNSLYSLLRPMGRRTSLANLGRELVDPSGKRVSMAEIQAAARNLGVGLSGRLVNCSDLPSDRPAIAYLQYPGEGHYIVVEPVGVHGTMVQIYDSPHDPVVMDKSGLCALPGWTGRVLLPTRWLDHAPAWAVAATLVLALAARIARRGTRRTAHVPPQTAVA